MDKAIKYFQDNGAYETIKRVIRRTLGAFGLTRSETYFLNLNIATIANKNTSFSNSQIQVSQLQKEHIDEFNNIKYYDSIKDENFIDSDCSTIFVALVDDIIVGFICCFYNIRHLIHGMGYWNLDVNEAWIGPTYVRKIIEIKV